jgi:alpha,alpha-trehalase
VWPPLVHVTVLGLARYGLHDDARRIARKFVDTQVALFQRTNRLWEKTDCETGAVAGAEYGAAAMLGWTAGTFLALTDYLG